jgi:hypothetical protein
MKEIAPAERLNKKTVRIEPEIIPADFHTPELKFYKLLIEMEGKCRRWVTIDRTGCGKNFLIGDKGARHPLETVFKPGKVLLWHGKKHRDTVNVEPVDASGQPPGPQHVIGIGFAEEDQRLHPAYP